MFRASSVGVDVSLAQRHAALAGLGCVENVMTKQSQLSYCLSSLSFSSISRVAFQFDVVIGESHKKTAKKVEKMKQ